MHGTFLGGFVSLVIKGLFFYYALLLVNKLITYGDDTNRSYEMPLSNPEPINLKKSNLRVGIRLYNIT